MLFSYLVPVYNVEKYIRQCLDSILRQRGAEFEVVLLDDGSTDNSGAICDEYAAAYPGIVRVIHKPNEGLLATRRRGFREAKGDWFLCVDSDDYIADNHLQTIADAIKQYNCDMVMFDYESLYPDGRAEPSGIDISDIQIYEGETKQEIYKKRLLTNKYNNIWAKAIKRSILDFDTDYASLGVRNMCEDAIQSYELYTRAERIMFLPLPLYVYRRSIASITANVSMDYWHAIRVCADLGWKYVMQWEVIEETAHAYGAKCICDYCNFLSWLLGESKLDDAKKKSVFQEVFLENEMFDLAVRHCRNAYFPTRYLRLRNPAILRCLRSKHPYALTKAIFALERKYKH